MKPTPNKVVHSQSKEAWNIIGTEMGGRYKIARIPYNNAHGKEDMEIYNTREKADALETAMFLSECLRKGATP